MAKPPWQQTAISIGAGEGYKSRLLYLFGNGQTVRSERTLDD